MTSSLVFDARLGEVPVQCIIGQSFCFLHHGEANPEKTIGGYFPKGPQTAPGKVTTIMNVGKMEQLKPTPLSVWKACFV